MPRKPKTPTPTSATISRPAAIAAAAAGLLPPGEAARAAGVSPRHMRTLRARARVEPELAARVATAADQLATLRAQTADDVLAAARAALANLTATAHEASWATGGAAQAVRLLQSWQTLTGQASSITEGRRITLDLTAAAVRAVDQYRAAGYTEAEALACLEEDDHELWRAHPARATQPPSPGEPPSHDEPRE